MAVLSDIQIKEFASIFGKEITNTTQIPGVLNQLKKEYDKQYENSCVLTTSNYLEGLPIVDFVKKKGDRQ